MGILHSAIGLMIIHYGLLLVLVPLVIFICLYILSKNVSEANRVLQISQLVKDKLIAKFGTGSIGLINLWITGLEHIQNGTLTKSQMIDEYVQYILNNLPVKMGEVATLSAGDEPEIRKLASEIVDIFFIDKKSTVKAMRVLEIK